MKPTLLQLPSLLIVFIFLIAAQSGVAQTTIDGIVTERNGTPIEGANVYLEGTYDGVTTDVEGKFSF